MAGQVALSGNNFEERLESLYKIGLFSDITVIVIDHETRENREFKAHKNILSLTGPVWETAVKWAKDNQIVVDNFSIEIMDCIISFAYTGKVSIKSLNFCVSIINTADYYSMSSLTNKCVDYIENFISYEKISLGEFVELFNLAGQYNIRRLFTACLGFIEDNPNEVLNSEEFMQLNKCCIDIIIAVNKYLCPEFIRASALIKWTKKNSGNELIQHFASSLNIYKSIRFSAMRREEIESLLENHREIFTDDEANAILTLLSYKKQKLDLPSEILKTEYINVEKTDMVIVCQPPMEIIEQFSYIGETLSIPFYGFIIQPKINSYIPTYNEDYEESLSIECGKEYCEYNEKTNRKVGTICKFSQHFSVQFQAVNYITVRITLKSCGIYKKDVFSPSPLYHGLLHSKRGLIKEIIHENKIRTPPN